MSWSSGETLPTATGGTYPRRVRFYFRATAARLESLIANHPEVLQLGARADVLNGFEVDAFFGRSGQIARNPPARNNTVREKNRRRAPGSPAMSVL
jgi:hypothetical protein